MSATFSVLYTELAARLNDATFVIWTQAQVKRYINGAISYWDMLGGYTPAIDQTTIVPADNQLTYKLPTAITNPRQILRILKRSSIKNVDQAIQDLATTYNPASDTPISEPWYDWQEGQIVFNGTQGKLLLADFLLDGEAIAIMYKAAHSALVSDGDTTDVPPEAIYAYGRYLAHNEMAAKASEADRKYHIEEREAALRDANLIIPMAIRQQMPDSVLKQTGTVLGRW